MFWGGKIHSLPVGMLSALLFSKKNVYNKNLTDMNKQMQKNKNKLNILKNLAKSSEILTVANHEIYI